MLRKILSLTGGIILLAGLKSLYAQVITTHGAESSAFDGGSGRHGRLDMGSTELDVDLFTGLGGKNSIDYVLRGRPEIRIERNYNRMRQHARLWRDIGQWEYKFYDDITEEKFVSPEVAFFGRVNHGWSLGFAPIVTLRPAYGNGVLDLVCSGTKIRYEDPTPSDPGYKYYYGKQWTHAVYQTVLPDGSEELLYQREAGAAYTASGWRYDCVGGIRKMTSPDGVSYTLGKTLENKQVIVAENFENSSYFHFLPTRMVNPDGGGLDYEYKDFFDSWRGVNVPRLSAIVASDGRRVDFDYEEVSTPLPFFFGGAEFRLRGIVDSKKNVVSYKYDAQGQLASATRLDAGEWRYEYYPFASFDPYENGLKFAPMNEIQKAWAMSGAIRKITNPSGGSVVVEYEPSEPYLREYFGWDSPWGIGGAQLCDPGCYGVQILAEWRLRVKRQSASNGRVTEYGYQSGVKSGEYDVRTVKNELGTERHYFIGDAWMKGTSGIKVNGEVIYPGAWRYGLNVESQFPGGKVIKKEWIAHELSRNLRQSIGSKIKMADVYSYRPVLSKRETILDGVSYTVEYSDYDFHGNPRIVAATNSGKSGMITKRSFSIDDVANIIRRISHESVTAVDK